MSERAPKATKQQLEDAAPILAALWNVERSRRLDALVTALGAAIRIGLLNTTAGPDADDLDQLIARARDA